MATNTKGIKAKAKASNTKSAKSKPANAKSREAQGGKCKGEKENTHQIKSAQFEDWKNQVSSYKNRVAEKDT